MDKIAYAKRENGGKHTPAKIQRWCKLERHDRSQMTSFAPTPKNFADYFCWGDYGCTFEFLTPCTTDKSCESFMIENCCFPD